MKVLLIEDNETIAKQLAEFLSLQHWQVDYASTAKQGIQLAINNIFDVILLDLNLPDGDGLDVCKKIKQEATVLPPILMLTARDSFDDKVKGFNEGADDYLTKPFDLREVVLRCKALARRQNLHQTQTIEVGELSLDLKSRAASRKGEPIKLTKIGFDILEILVKAHPDSVSRSFIIHSIWSDNPPESDALKSHIYSLRKSLDKSFNKPMLKTIMNVGFKLDI